MNLLDVLEGNQWSIQQALQTTFPFDPQFYSSYVRPRLQRRNCELPLVLVDGTRYEQEITSSDWREAPIGTDYLLEPVHSSGVFHPKINLFASERSVFYSISSANLTLEEYCKAAQIGFADGFQKSTLTSDEADVGDSYFLARDVRDFYLELIDWDGLITGQDARNYITETGETLEWLDDVSADNRLAESDRRTWFLSNLSGPILSQALDTLDRISDGQIDRVRLYAPYYGTPTVLERLAARIDPDHIEFLVEPESTALDVAGLPDAMAGFEYDVRRMDARRVTRWVHGKFIMFEGPWGQACLYGSPNMTSSALLAGASGGNVEAALLTLSEAESSEEIANAVFNSGSYQFDISEPIDDPESLDLRSESYEGWESMRLGTRDDLHLQDVRLTQPGSDEESELILSISGLDGQYDFVIRTDDGESEMVEATVDVDGSEVPVYLSPDKSEVWAGAVVTVEVDGQRSNPRRVVEERRAYYSEYRDMTKSAGTQSSNTLLRGILQNPDRAAISVFDIALSELRKSAKQSGDSTRQPKADREESYPERNPKDLTSRGGSLPSLHTLVDQHLSYHRERAYAAVDVEEQPEPDNVKQFVEHTETFWETIELCYALDQLGQLDTGQVNSKRLFSQCREQINQWLKQSDLVVQRLNGIINQIENVDRVRQAFLGGKTTEPLDLDIWQGVADVLFFHPGIVLEFAHRSTHSITKSETSLASGFAAIFREIQPHVGQYVLNGHLLVQRTETLLDNLAVELGAEDSEIRLSGTGIRVLVLYILIQRTDADGSLSEALRVHPQFSGDAASKLARFVLESENEIISYNLVGSLQWEIRLKGPRAKLKELIGDE